jgi:hypothetical protein
LKRCAATLLAVPAILAALAVPARADVSTDVAANVVVTGLVDVAAAVSADLSLDL